MDPRVRWLSIGLILLCAGCAAASLPTRYPSTPPSGMTAERASQDQDGCVSVAASATVERAWAYIGCMVSKGHSVGVAFHSQGVTTFLDVTQTRPHEATAISSELEKCRRSAYAAGRAGERDTTMDRMEISFRACVEPLGYTVRRHAAAPGDRRSRADGREPGRPPRA